MTTPSGGPSSQNTANLAGGPYGAWSGTNQTALIGPAGALVPLGGVGGGVALYDGTNSITSGTAQFSNANGVSFGFNGQTITASAAGAAQSVQTQASGGIAGTGFTTTTTNGVVLVGTNDTGGLKLAVPPYLTTYAQTNQTVASGGIAGSGFTTNATAGVVMVGTNNSAGLNLGVPAWITTWTAPSSYVSNVNGSSGALSFATGSSLSSSVNGSTITWGLASNITTALQSAGAYLTTAAQTSASNVSVVYAATNNTGGGTATLSGGVSFTNANSATFYTSAGNAIALSFSTSQSVQTQASGNIPRTGITTGATAGSQLAGTHDTGGISLGVPAWITTYAAQTVQPVNASAANGSFNFSTISFSNVNGVSFATAAGPAIQASIATTYAGVGTTTTTQAGSTLGATLNTAGLSLAVPAWLTIAAGAGDGYNIVSVGASTFGGATGGTATSWASTTIGLHAGSNITLSQSSNSVVFYGPSQSVQTQASGDIARSGFTTNATAGSVLVGTLNSGGLNVGVPAWITTYVAQTVQGQTLTVSAANTSYTVPSLSFSNNGNVSFSLSNNSQVYATATFAQSNQAFSAAGGSSAFQTLSFSDNGYASWTNNAGQIALTEIRGSFFAVGNTTQSSSGTQNLDAISLSGGGMAAVGVTNGSLVFNVGTGTAITGPASISLNSAGISFNGTALAGTGSGTGSTTGALAFGLNSNGLTISQPYRTRWIYPDGMGLTNLGAFGNATMSVQYLDAQLPVTATRLDALVSWSAGASSATTNTCAWAMSQYAIIYTRNGSTLSSLSSGSTQTTYTVASNTAGQTAMLQGAIRPVSVPINVNMVEGEYYVGFNIITATSSIGLSTTNLGLSLSMMGATVQSSMAMVGDITQATNTSVGWVSGMGIWSAGTTGVLNAAGGASLSGINQTGTAIQRANIALMFRNA